MICPDCGKENQDKYRFCLGCGADLRASLPNAPAPNPLPAAPSPAPRVPAARDAQPAPRPQGQPMPLAPEPGPCPGCGAVNPAENRFCASCGRKLAADTYPGRGSPAKGQEPAHPAPSALVLKLLNPDGSEAGSFPLPAGTTVVGREIGGPFAKDSYLSPRHAALTPNGEQLTVADESSLNGVFRKLVPDQPFAVESGQVFRIGQQLIRFEALAPKPPENGVEYLGGPAEGYVGRIVMMLGRRSTGAAFPVPETGLELGRERGDVLFGEDGYVSGAHCRLGYQQGQVVLTDLGSSNGTFVRIRGQAEIAAGQILLLGQQLFRVVRHA